VTKPSLSRSDVFINLPFDDRHERIFLAMIAGLVGLGLNPRSVVQIPASVDRLRRLVRIIQECPFSVHDLSRVSLCAGGQFRVPRFNMPFELGLAAAISFAESGSRHDWRLMEAVPYRLQVSLSDVDGYDPAIHNGTVEGTLEALLNVFPNRPGAPLAEVEDLLWVYRRLRAFRNTLPRRIYAPNPFGRLVLAAAAIVEKRRNILASKA
jgi:hypothetical protein